MPSAVRRRLLAPLLLAALVAGLGTAAPAVHAAAVETVTNLDDAGAGSLRQAIVDVDAGGSVAFAAGLNGTITLTGGQIVIGKALTVDGPGAQQLTVSGNDSSRIFDVVTGDDVELSGMTLTQGRVDTGSSGEAHGGAVRKINLGTLTIRDSQITDSTVTASGFGAFGGGVSVMLGDLMMERVTFAGNQALGTFGYGGGFALHSNAGAATLRNLTFSGNSATQRGGGLFLGNSNTGAPVVLEHLTVAGNTASDGGGLANGVTAQLVASIVAGNTADTAGPNCWTGIAGIVELRGPNLIDDASGCSIGGTGGLISDEDPRLGPLALNAPGQTETMALTAGSLALDPPPTGDDACPPPATDQRGITRPQGAACDIGAYEARPAVAQLSPPAHDFGLLTPGSGPTAPFAFTLSNDADADLALTIDAIALDGADTGQFTLDTSDCPATLAPGASCDVEAAFAPTSDGAKEATLEVETSGGDLSADLDGRGAAAVETVTNLADAGPGSLRQAVADVAADGTVAFAAGLNGTITLTGGQIVIGKALTVDGPGAQQLTVSGNDSSRIFDVDTGGDVELSGLALTRGRVDTTGLSSEAHGGAVRKTGLGKLTIRDSEVTDSEVITGSSYAGFGGGVSVLRGALVLERATFADNQALGVFGSGGGLALHSNAGAATLRNVTFFGNAAAQQGGGLLVYNPNTGAPVVLEHLTVAGNRAPSGGGIRALVATQLVNSIVAGNTAGTEGPDCSTGVSGSLNLRGGNLIEDATGCRTTGAGSLISGEDPRLGPLALDAPGQTETMALTAGSPALDAAPTTGDGACPPPATDQRGVTRPQGTACDLGAYEARPAVAELAPTASDFGRRERGSGAGAPISLTLANADDAELDLAIDAIELTGPDADQFTLDASACPATLAPGGTCTIGVAFAPTRDGALTATVALASSGGSASATVTGAGFTPHVDPPPAPVVDPPAPLSPPVVTPPQPGPPPTLLPPRVTRFALAQRCVRPARSGRVRIGLRVELTRATRVRVQIARGLGTGGLAHCPRRSSSARFDGRFVTVDTLTPASVATSASAAAASAAAVAPSANTAATTRRYLLTPRLEPGLYRITVRPYTGARALGRPAHRYLRVLAR